MMHIVKQLENHWMMHWLAENNKDIQLKTLEHYKKGQHREVLFFLII